MSEVKQLSLEMGVWGGHKNIIPASAPYINQGQTSTWEEVKQGIEELGVLSSVSKLKFSTHGGLYMGMR